MKPDRTLRLATLSLIRSPTLASSALHPCPLTFLRSEARTELLLSEVAGREQAAASMQQAQAWLDATLAGAAQRVQLLQSAATQVTEIMAGSPQQPPPPPRAQPPQPPQPPPHQPQWPHELPQQWGAPPPWSMPRPQQATPPTARGSRF